MHHTELEWLKLELMQDDECGRIKPLPEYLARCETAIERMELRDWFERGYARCRSLFSDLTQEEALCREMVVQALCASAA